MITGILVDSMWFLFPKYWNIHSSTAQTEVLPAKQVWGWRTQPRPFYQCLFTPFPWSLNNFICQSSTIGRKCLHVWVEKGKEIVNISSGLNWPLVAVVGIGVNLLQGKYVPRYFIKQVWVKSLYCRLSTNYESESRYSFPVLQYLKEVSKQELSRYVKRCRTNFMFPKETTTSSTFLSE